MRHKTSSSGFSLVELLVSVGIIVLLLLAVCAAIMQTLRIEALHAGRAAMGRTASQLADRLQEDARSSTAVFIPSTDVLGFANSGMSGAHEVDFFRRQSAGGDAFVAYLFDSSSGSVTRYEYSAALGIKTVLASDLAGAGIGSFAAIRKPVAGVLAGQQNPARVSIFYGSHELEGGNDIVVVMMVEQQSGGAPGQKITVHLAARAAPTALAILAPAGPPPTPPPTIIIPFIILRPGFALHPPHGPIHWGSGGASDPAIHWVAALGSAQFYGNGPNLAGSWLDLSNAYSSLSSGNYAFRSSNGSSITASITCAGGLCPLFHTLPVSAPGFTPAGGVAFQSIF